MSDYWEEEIRELLRSDRGHLVICGSGVSRQASGGRAPDWASLIGSGIDLVQKQRASTDAWVTYSRERLAEGKPAQMIAVADEITEHLGGARNPEFAKWIRSTIGEISAVSSVLTSSIVKIGGIIATTNYDDVLTSSTGLPPVLWTDHEAVVKVLKGEKRGILHLHGHWDSPESIVLGSKSYDNILEDERSNFVKLLSALTLPSILIGCGEDGLSDPDFSAIDRAVLRWLPATERRYWLVKSGQQRDIANLKDRRIYAVDYGAAFDDLPAFLQRIAPLSERERGQGQVDVRTVDFHEPKPEIYGRDSELDIVVDATLTGNAVTISGGPGMGKTALALAALYHPRVVEKFKQRRIFTSLEGSYDSRRILDACAEALGLSFTGEDANVLRGIQASVERAPAAIVIDNAEDVIAQDQLSSEKYFRLLSQCAGLSLIVTGRGVPPSLPGGRSVVDLPKLDGEASRRTFLDAAGSSLAEDVDLDGLLVVLDGHALSLKIVGAQAAGLYDLRGIKERWESAKADILRRPGAVEGRITSVRASVALSLDGPHIRNDTKARRLIGLLALLPDGLLEADVRHILGHSGAVTKAEASAAVSTLQTLRLVERRPDARLRMLTPIRETVALDYPATLPDRRRLATHFFKLIEKGKSVGRATWGDHRQVVVPEVDNMDAVILDALGQGWPREKLSEYMYILGDVAGYVGKRRLISLEAAWAKWLPRPDGSTASVGRKLASLLVAQGRYDEAKAYLDQSFAMAQKAGAKQMAANSLSALAHISYCVSDYGESLRKYTRSSEMYEKTGDRLGRTNAAFGHIRVKMALSKMDGILEDLLTCRENYRKLGALTNEAGVTVYMGELHSCGGDLVGARNLLLNANEAFELSGDELGIRSSKARIAYLDIDEGEYGRAERSLSETLSSSMEVLSKEGAAVSLAGLSRLACVTGRADSGLIFINDAIPLFESLGDPMRRAVCLIRRGIIYKLLQKTALANADIVNGFEIYFGSVGDMDRASEGWRALRDALLSSSESEASRHWEAARQAWTGIGRLDYVREWIEEVRPLIQ